MNQILDCLTICEIIPAKQKLEINIVFVFDDRSGYDILFITKEDKVYGFGSNCYGSIGLGFNGVVDAPKLIPELCGRKIVEFYNGLNFVMARAVNFDIYGWGDNSWGQLGRGTTSQEKRFQKPVKVNFFDQYELTQISCGKFHCLAVTKDDQLFGWGDNRVGQIGCENSDLKLSSTPILVNKFSVNKIKDVFCSYNRSFALISDGTVYSWGENMWRELGHELEQNETLFRPKLINLHNVVNVCPSHRNTYFLTKDGSLYFCGRDEAEITLQSGNENYQYVPRLMTKKIKFEELHQISSYQKYSALSTAIYNGHVYEIAGNKLTKTNYNSFLVYYIKELQMTFKNLVLKEDSFISNLSELSIDESKNKTKFESIEFRDSGFLNESETESSNYTSNSDEVRNFTNDGLYEERHERISLIGKGGFGFVVKVFDKLDKQEYAVKIVQSKDIHLDLYNRIMKELEIMAKLNSDFVINYKTSWVDSSGKVFIKMEYCADNLKNIVEKKALAFNRKLDLDSMIAIEYFFSCELFKELLECVKYLHESEPPLIHRDLKPSNILISYNNRNGRFLKVCDFGLSTFHEKEYMSHTQELGTRKYIAFEVSQSTQYDTRADVYSVGIIGQELFGFDINSTDNISKFENMIREKFKVLESMIISMLHNLYRQRPSCACILEHYHEFSLDRNKVKGSQNFDSIMKRLKDYENQFFYTFMNKKLN